MSDYPISVSSPYLTLGPTTTPPSVAVYKGSTVGAVRTFTATATVSGTAGLTRTVTVAYWNSRYGGANSQATALSSAQTVALGRLVIDNSIYGGFSVSAAAGSYIWYSYRAALGQVPYFAINGERAAFTRIGTGTVVVTNSSGFAEPFEQYRSTSGSTGTNLPGTANNISISPSVALPSLASWKTSCDGRAFFMPKSIARTKRPTAAFQKVQITGNIVKMVLYDSWCPSGKRV